MNEIDKLKQRFLDGDISSAEYEQQLSIIKNKLIDKAIERKSDIDNNDNYTKVVFSLIVATFLVIFIAYISSKNTTKEANVSEKTAKPVKTKQQIAKEDSLYKIEVEKVRKEQIAEEAAFMKTRSGRIYKKHP